MTRAGLRFVALTAAGITVGTLGYAVLWAYRGLEGPPAAVSATPDAPKPPAAPKTAPPTVTNSVPSPKKPAPGVVATLPKPPAPTPAEPAPPAAVLPGPTVEKSAALPPPESRREDPALSREITVIRGGRVRVASRARASDEPKYAALPPSHRAQTATDAPPILVIRGGRGSRIAMAGAAEPDLSTELLFIAVRGGGARAAGPVYYVQPSALILHIPR